MAKILITGGSGLIGMHLSELLTGNGHQVIHLSRSENPNAQYKTYRWDLKQRYLDPEALEGAEHVIHLAGANISDKRWSARRKKILLSSRVDSLGLLRRAIDQCKVKPKSFISVSGISYYGMDTGDLLLDEKDSAGTDFLAELVQKWEAAAHPLKKVTRLTILRMGVVLSDEGGALPIMARPVWLYVGAPLGSGKQVVSWIHIQDVCRMFHFVLENEIEGTYNAVAPDPVTNRELTTAIASVLHRPLLLPNVPGFLLKLLFGEMAGLVLGGNNVLCKSIQNKGFRYNFIRMEQSIKDLLS